MMRNYPREWLRFDVIAGLTAAAVVIPKGMAYATIAGLPLQVGLYTVFVPMVIYALLGTSRVLSVSTTTTIAILSAAELARVAPNGDPGTLIAASATLAVLTGAMLVVASVVRLGFVANFISEPVLTGFKSGIGLVIVIDQLPKLLGVHIDKAGFFRDVLSIVGALPHAHVLTLVLGLVLLVMIFGLEHFLPRMPAPLVAIGAAILASWAMGLGEAGVAIVGPIPGGLPTFVLPRVEWLADMWPAAAGIALMSFTETIASARAFAAPGDPRLDPNRELLATGLANAGGGLLGAMPAGGGTTQTAVNRKSGARSQVAELVTAAAALATLLILAPVIALMPMAALAAVVVAYSFDLIKPAEFKAIREVRHNEFRWALIAFAGVVVLGTLKGILVAVIVSLLSLAQQAYNPPVYAVGRRREGSGLLVLRTEGRLFFANAQLVFEKMRVLIEEARPSVVVIDCSSVIDIEYTAVKMLVEAEAKLRSEGITLCLAAVNRDALDVVQRSKLGPLLGEDRLFASVELAEQRFAEVPRSA